MSVHSGQKYVRKDPFAVNKRKEKREKETDISSKKKKIEEKEKEKKPLLQEHAKIMTEINKIPGTQNYISSTQLAKLS